MINKGLPCIALLALLSGCASNQVTQEPAKEKLPEPKEVVKEIEVESEKELMDRTDYLELLSNELLKSSDVFDLNADSLLVQIMITSMNDAVQNGRVVPLDKPLAMDSNELYCQNISKYSKEIMSQKQIGRNIVKEYDEMAKVYKAGMKQIIDSDLPEETKIKRMENETDRIKIMHFLTKLANYAPRYRYVEDKEDSAVFFENVIYKSCKQKMSES